VKDFGLKGGESSLLVAGVLVSSVCARDKRSSTCYIVSKSPTPITNTKKIEEEKI
jgi:hypothetical protein